LNSNDSRSRPTALIFTAAPPDTPPTSSYSPNGSQSSIDATRLSAFFETYRPNSVASSRIRARGHGHRRRSTQSQSSRVSMVETIDEEVPELGGSVYSAGSSVSSMVSSVPSSAFDFAQAHEPQVDIVDWEEDAGNEVMRRYHALRKDAINIVQQSKQEWADTDFSRFAVASFKPPQDPTSIQAFYDHSVRTYTPLPLELVFRRQRTNSRTSPYGQRFVKRSQAPPMPRGHSRTESMEQAFSCISPPALSVIPPGSPFVIDRSFTIPSAAQEALKPLGRQRVTSNVRRSALGWSKQRVAEGAKVARPMPHHAIIGKENGPTEGSGLLMSPTESLRLSRPRPRNRPQSMLASIRV